MWHMACSYHTEDNRTDVILFGGNIRRRSQAEKHVVTGLTILSFGKFHNINKNTRLAFQYEFMNATLYSTPTCMHLRVYICHILHLIFLLTL